MIARNMNRPPMTIVVATIMTALATSVVAGQPNYPPEPTVIEYTVDPAWPKRPAELGPRAAVPSIAVDQQDRVSAPAALSIEEMKQLHEETIAYQRRLDLAVVLYTAQLCPAIKPVMKYVDVVSLWIWDGKDIEKIDANFKRYRSLVPHKPTLLGIYMWDFGGKKELSREFMATQLDYAYTLYKEGQIEGLIFHCTPLCNKGLAAVDYARQWIAKYGKEGRARSG